MRVLLNAGLHLFLSYFGMKTGNFSQNCIFLWSTVYPGLGIGYF